MKRNTVFALIISILLVFALTAFLPASARAASVSELPTLPAVLQIVITIALGFASLAGVSALVAVLVNLGKVLKIVKDGTANQWAAGLNLAAFVGLVAFGVFKPDLSMEILSGYAGQIATVLLFVLGFIMQITGSQSAYDQLKSASIPLISKSFSE